MDNKQNDVTLNIEKIREDFPVLSGKVHKKPLIYFDNGATTQKPKAVINRLSSIYEKENSSIHRGVHFLSGEMTNVYENARQTVADYLNAADKKEIIFTSGATGSINLLAFSFGEKYITPGDEIIISGMEHHANLVPWQMMAERKSAKIKVLPVTPEGALNYDALEPLFNEKTKLVAINHVSNALGTINNAKKIVAIAHKHDVPVLLDGAQAVQHLTIDVQDIGCDFYVFSGHKIYAPTGIGVLYGKEKWLEELPPYQGGGDMVDKVTFEKTTYNEIPFKFEAGTTNYIGAAGLSTAINYLQVLGLQNIQAWENELRDYMIEKMSQMEGIQLYGTAPEKIATFSFLLDNIHFYDAGMILDKLGIAVRTGTHCTQPLMQQFGIEGTIRASLAFYNTKEEIDIFIKGVEQVKMMFG